MKRKKFFCENDPKKWVSNPASEFAIVAPRLKPQTIYYQNSNCIYEYNCDDPCEASYEGKTQHILHERILEHRRDESSAIYQHYKYCDHYDKKVRDKYKVDPEYLPQTVQREIFESHFKILEKNLYHKGFRGLTYNP